MVAVLDAVPQRPTVPAPGENSEKAVDAESQNGYEKATQRVRVGNHDFLPIPAPQHPAIYGGKRTGTE